MQAAVNPSFMEAAGGHMLTLLAWGTWGLSLAALGPL